VKRLFFNEFSGNTGVFIIIIIIIIIITIIVFTAIEFSPGSSSPFNSTDKTNPKV